MYVFIKIMKLGLVGTGHMGKTHLYNSIKHPNIDVIAIADKLKSNRSKAKKLGISKIYDDYEKLFNKEEIDAVVISLPNFLRVNPIEIAAENGINVLVEKPLCRTPAEAKEIEKIINKHSIKLMVSVNCRFYPHIVKLKSNIDEGRYGDIVSASFDHIMHGPFTHPLLPKPVAEWWFNKDSVGGGTLIDNGYHILDLFNWFFPDSKILSAKLDYIYNLEIEDSAIITLQSQRKKTTGIINSGWYSHNLFPKVDFRVIVHGHLGYENTENLIPNLYIHAAKTALGNIARKLTFRQIKYFAYTYYYESYLKSLDFFFRTLEKDGDFDDLFKQQKQVINLIDNAYKIGGQRI